jgi:hypothetical protein
MHLRTTILLMIVAGPIADTAFAQSVPNLTQQPFGARPDAVSVGAERDGGAHLLRAASTELARIRVAGPSVELSPVRLQPAQSRSWIGRHPILCGAMVGFGGGVLIGYARGDNGVFDDFTGTFNGLVLGGVGAGVGALVGQFVAAGR